ncbi:MAG: signal peptidase I [Deltaproteobacteria bacterium]|nr:signal peptidase I [Deltaproteobacteria bacterium]
MGAKQLALKKGHSDALPANPEITGKSKLRENIEAILIAIVLALFIRTFVVQAFKIPSGSMKPTLQIGDHLLVNKFIYGIKLPFIHKTIIPISEPKRKDIIVFPYPVNPDMDFIKRVIGLPGDTIRVKNKKIYINNKLLSPDPGVHSDPSFLPAGLSRRDNYGPITVPEGQYFVMGDNRDNSYDSRFWGFVDKSVILGKAFIIYWSWNSEDFGVRWRRTGMLLH